MRYPWNSTRRFNAYSDYFRALFGERIQKITINAGFTCPNRDGTCGWGGCTYCDNRAFIPSYAVPGKTVEEQINQGIRFHQKRYRKVKKYLAYFQAYSNTYAPLEELKKIYRPALDHPDIVGIIVGTRPDCIDDAILDYFEELSRTRYVVLEYGIESVYDRTLLRINRGHDFAASVKALEATAGRGIRTGGHIIVGLPGETVKDWIEEAGILSHLPLSNIKFHQLQIIKGTVMAKEFLDNPGDFTHLGLNDYLSIIADILERLNPKFIVERIAGEINPGLALTRGWGVRYDEVLRRFENVLEVRDTWQGRLYEVKS
ncbi:MAG: TIGR01212 family radical SAM protein [Bacteroidales bacterium]|nr:TIGR01212 family radical SAM protein [Bacteroidales bacterium]MBN2697890.1 TIGR01212 family radical SAM protein [Bacteroidales bacterium]